MTIKQSQCVSLSETNPEGFPQYDNIATLPTEAENAMTLSKLGSMYEKGMGVFTDYVNSYMWYFIAEHKGCTESSAGRARVAKKMTPIQINKAQTMALQCLPGGHAHL